MHMFHGIDWDEVERKAEKLQGLREFAEQNPQLDCQIIFPGGEPTLTFTVREGVMTSKPDPWKELRPFTADVYKNCLDWRSIRNVLDYYLSQFPEEALAQ